MNRAACTHAWRGEGDACAGCRLEKGIKVKGLGEAAPPARFARFFTDFSGRSGKSCPDRSEGGGCGRGRGSGAGGLREGCGRGAGARSRGFPGAPSR